MTLVAPSLLVLNNRALPIILNKKKTQFNPLPQMAYRHNQTVEIIGKQEPYLGSYYPATLLAAIGKTRYLVRYQTRFTDDKSRLLVESLHAADIRPVPPEIQTPDIAAGDRVEVCANGGWWVGRIVKKVDPVYYVRLDSDGSEMRCPLYRVRKHLEWEDGKWVCSGIRNGPQNFEAKGAEEKA